MDKHTFGKYKAGEKLVEILTELDNKLLTAKTMKLVSEFNRKVKVLFAVKDQKTFEFTLLLVRNYYLNSITDIQHEYCVGLIRKDFDQIKEYRALSHLENVIHSISGDMIKKYKTHQTYLKSIRRRFSEYLEEVV